VVAGTVVPAVVGVEADDTTGSDVHADAIAR
jgi:hypothetical protein